MKIKSILFSGAMLAFTIIPMNTGSLLSGDVNADGVFNIADVVTFQQWLVGNGSLADWKSADVYEDDVLDVFDLCKIKSQLINDSSVGRNINVSNIDELFDAVRNAIPNDVIIVASGTYDYTTYQGADKIDISASGEENAPITIKAEDSENPPVITGKTTENGYVFHITGDYWVVENLCITTSQKGIVLDNSNYTTIRNCDIGNTGAEAIAIRDGSSYCVVKDCNIHDSGIVSSGYGEGVYIGSAYSTSGFDYKCDYNIVDGCIFKNVSAEHIDVKEFTTGTEICNCIFYGTGMSGENYAGSFIDIAGNDCYVHDNTGYRENNPQIVAGFEIHNQVDGWGVHHRFENNVLYMDREYGEIDTSRRMYVVDGWFSDFEVYNNLVDYGNGLVESLPEYYNSSYVTFK